MSTRRRGQSLVEMALLAPILLLVIFLIVDMGYYIYGYSTIYNAARRGSEQASKTPPSPGATMTDPCYAFVVGKIAAPDATALFPNIGTGVTIVYPDAIAPSDGRQVGLRVRVTVTQQLRPLTPVMQWLNASNGGVMTVVAESQRTIENLGQDLTQQDGMACN